MRFSLLSLLLLFANAHSEITEEDGVLILTKDNFNEAIEKYQFVLVNFYAPWCSHCKYLASRYIEAASKLNEENSLIKLAKVDAIVETSLAEEHKISGYPTLIYFGNKEPLTYHGAADSDAIVSWCKRKTQSEIKVLESVDDHDKFINSSSYTVIVYSKSDEEDFKNSVEKVATLLDNIAFAWTANPELFSKHKVTKPKCIRLFKQGVDGFVEYPEESIDNLEKFLRIELVPLVTEFTHESAQLVFSSPIQKNVIAFMSKLKEYEKWISDFTKVAKEFKGKLHVIIVDTDTEDHKRILDFFGIQDSELPTFRIVDLVDEPKKYKPYTNSLSASEVIAFINDYLDGKIQRTFMSEEIPTGDTGSVRVLVGKNYNEVVRDQSKIVCVKLYAPWCGHCKSLLPVWEQLGELYKGGDIIIAKMDATVNEVEGLKVSGFPTIKLYPKDSNIVIDYDGDRSLESLKKFIESNGQISESAKPTSDDKDEL